MKILLIVGLFALFSALFGAALVAGANRKKEAEEIDIDAMLWAIAQVESGNDPHAVNARTGERGRCQFTRATWRQYTNAEFETWAASGAELVHSVERAHYWAVWHWLHLNLDRVTPELIGAAWKWGMAAAERHEDDERSERIGNLYRDEMKRRAAARLAEAEAAQ